jgi:hypothetical protein
MSPLPETPAPRASGWHAGRRPLDRPRGPLPLEGSCSSCGPPGVTMEQTDSWMDHESTAKTSYNHPPPDCIYIYIYLFMFIFYYYYYYYYYYYFHMLVHIYIYTRSMVQRLRPHKLVRCPGASSNSGRKQPEPHCGTWLVTSLEVSSLSLVASMGPCCEACEVLAVFLRMTLEVLWMEEILHHLGCRISSIHSMTMV